MKSQVKTWHVYIYVYPSNNSKYSCCSSMGTPVLTESKSVETGFARSKSEITCLFWPQGPLIQSSAAPQGSPLPTQQINIRMPNQLSWAINHGWSPEIWWHWWMVSTRNIFPWGPSWHFSNLMDTHQKYTLSWPIDLPKEHFTISQPSWVLEFHQIILRVET